MLMFSVCSHLGGVPISHNALQHFPECHGAAGGDPARSSRGYPPGPARGVPWPGGLPWLGGYPGRGYPGLGGTLPGPAGGVPGWGGNLAGGYPGRGGTLAGGYPGRGGTQLGQHREYLLHGGQYASYVHTGGHVIK